MHHPKNTVGIQDITNRPVLSEKKVSNVVVNQHLERGESSISIKSVADAAGRTAGRPYYSTVARGLPLRDDGMVPTPLLLRKAPNPSEECPPLSSHLELSSRSQPKNGVRTSQALGSVLTTCSRRIRFTEEARCSIAPKGEEDGRVSSPEVGLKEVLDESINYVEEDAGSVLLDACRRRSEAELGALVVMEDDAFFVCPPPSPQHEEFCLDYLISSERVP